MEGACEGAFLLNDDSPVLRVEDDVVRVYGSLGAGNSLLQAGVL